MRKLAAIAVAAALALAGCKPKQTAPQYVTQNAERGRIVGRVTATGTLSALVTVQVGTQVSGRVANLYVDFNSPVKKGMTLAKIDPALFEASLESAKANELQAEGQLAQAKATAVNAKLQYQRNVQLIAKNLVAQADVDTAKSTADATAAAVQAAEGNLAQAKAQRHQAEVNLAYTTIISPIDGTVISRAVDVGQTVAASLSAPTLFTIAQDLSKMQVDTNVAEADVGKLEPGMPASFTVDAYTGEKFKGTIRQIRNAAQTVQNVVTYDAVIDVPNPDLKLRPGMTANVTFVFAQANDALMVPNAALRFKPEGASGPGGHHGAHADGGAGMAWKNGGGRGANASGNDGGEAKESRTIYVLRDNAPVPVSITTGITDGTNTEVVSGDLKEGDAIITDSNGGASEGKSSSGPPKGGGFGRMF